ncbi:MAG: ANTAR domain-containing protein [Acidimicrobiales bacterium]
MRMVTALGTRQGVELTAAGMCVACAEVLSVAGAAIVLSAGGGVQGATHTSNAWVEPLEEMQFTLGVGPGADAYERSVPVVEADLVTDAPGRWMSFGANAVDAGVGAVFSFPLQIGAVRMGALTLYQTGAGPLDNDTYADALVMAEVITRAVLGMQVGAEDGSLAAELSDGEILHAEVHQASGMVSVQLDIGVGEALARLRARAFAEGTTVRLVSIEIVARRLRFDP